MMRRIQAVNLSYIVYVNAVEDCTCYNRKTELQKKNSRAWAYQLLETTNYKRGVKLYTNLHGVFWFIFILNDIIVSV